MRRRRGKEKTETAMRARMRDTQAAHNRLRSGRERSRNLRMAVTGFDETFRSKSFEELEQVQLTTFRLDLKAVQHGVPNTSDGPWPLDQFPHYRTHGIQRIVDAGVEIEDSGFATEVTGDLVGGGVNDGAKSHELGLRGNQLRFRISASRPPARNMW